MKKILAGWLLFAVFSSAALSQGFFGVRPLGMGGAFTAISDDANAVMWNPAGLAINPGVDISGSFLITNRNEAVGDNSAGIKMCYETEVSPFAWILGIGAASALAFKGAQYLSDSGVIKKNWGRSDEAAPQTQSLAEEVKEKGSEVTQDVSTQAKEKAKQTVSEMSQKASEIGGQIAKEIAAESLAQSYGPGYPYYLPFYQINYRRPTYWDDRGQSRQNSPQGKAQFALGLNYVGDRNTILDQNTNWYAVSVASGYEERIALGANLNIYSLSLASNTSINGLGGSLDIGGLFRPMDKFSLGIAAKEILTTDIRWSNGASTRYPMNVNVGIAIKPINAVTLSLDSHNIFSQNNASATMHYGVEVRPAYGIALRGGLNDGSKTAGASLGASNFYVDYAYLGGAFARTQMLGFTYKM